MPLDLAGFADLLDEVDIERVGTPAEWLSSVGVDWDALFAVGQAHADFSRDDELSRDRAAGVSFASGFQLGWFAAEAKRRGAF